MDNLDGRLVDCDYTDLPPGCSILTEINKVTIDTPMPYLLHCDVHEGGHIYTLVEELTFGRTI